MNKVRIVLTLALALGASLTTVPDEARAERHGHHGRSSPAVPVVADHRVVVDHRVVTRTVVPHRPFVTSPFVHRPFFRPFVPFVIASPFIAYPAFSTYYTAPPSYSYPSPSYSYAPPPSYSYPPSSYDLPAGAQTAVAPPAPPMPTVVLHPTGRYELRGDGITTPYVWVWIPNPPSAPPPPASPPAAPRPALPESSSGNSSGHSRLYRWNDDEGVVHWTDRWDAVPERYRTQAKRLTSS